LVGAYALDALNSEERSLVEQHLDACAACAEEVVELRAVAAELAADAAEPPPVSLRSAVMTQVAVTRQDPPAARQDPPVARRPASEAPGAPGAARAPGAPGAPGAAGAADAVPPRGPGRRPRRWVRPLTIAAAAGLLAASGGLGAVVLDQQSRLDTAQQRSEVLDTLASAALDSSVSRPVTGGGRLAVVGVRGEAPAVALVVARDLPDLPAGKIYQLWVVGADAPKPAGTLAGGTGGAGGTDRVVTTSATDTSVALTVEPTGGSLQPTTPMLVSIPLRT
jgi:anti-sigma-K factor RskA